MTAGDTFAEVMAKNHEAMLRRREHREAERLAAEERWRLANTARWESERVEHERRVAAFMARSRIRLRPADPGARGGDDWSI